MVTAADAVPDDVDALKAALLAERARSADATARALQIEAELARARAATSGPFGIIYRSGRFRVGRLWWSTAMKCIS